MSEHNNRTKDKKNQNIVTKPCQGAPPLPYYWLKIRGTWHRIYTFFTSLCLFFSLSALMFLFISLSFFLLLLLLLSHLIILFSEEDAVTNFLIRQFYFLSPWNKYANMLLYILHRRRFKPSTKNGATYARPGTHNRSDLRPTGLEEWFPLNL